MSPGVNREVAGAGKVAFELFEAMGWTWSTGTDDELIPTAVDLALAFRDLIEVVRSGGDDSLDYAGTGRLMALNHGEGEITLAIEVGHIYLEEGE